MITDRIGLHSALLLIDAIHLTITRDYVACVVIGGGVVVALFICFPRIQKLECVSLDRRFANLMCLLYSLVSHFAFILVSNSM